MEVVHETMTICCCVFQVRDSEKFVTCNQQTLLIIANAKSQFSPDAAQRQESIKISDIAALVLY